jgi:hypothetical protein
MDYNIDPLFAVIVGAVTSSGSLSDRMACVIDECERQNPHADWQRIRRIAFQSDESALSSWLPKILARAGRGASIKGLWFGLNNPIVRGAVTADIYVGASESYAANSLDWATELVEIPMHGSLKSKVLDAIYTEAYGRGGGLENDAEYPLVLAYGTMCALKSLEKVAPIGALRGLCGAACGFDSGDAFQLGQFNHTGFSPKVVVA